MIKITVREHLKELEAQEGRKVAGRTVPSIPDLAAAVGVTRATIYNLDKSKSLNLDLLDRIVVELRRRGFNTNLEDVLIYMDASPLSHHSETTPSGG